MKSSSKTKKETWKKDLSKTLKEKKIEDVSPRLISLAVSEIISGVRFCMRKEMSIIGSTLSRNFDVRDGCKCLFAKNHQSKHFATACDSFGISLDMASTYGVSQSDKWTDAVYAGGSGPDADILWRQVYNILWRRTGRFFKDNPQYGVK